MSVYLLKYINKENKKEHIKKIIKKFNICVKKLEIYDTLLIKKEFDKYKILVDDYINISQKIVSLKAICITLENILEDDIWKYGGKELNIILENSKFSYELLKNLKEFKKCNEYNNLDKIYISIINHTVHELKYCCIKNASLGRKMYDYINKLNNTIIIKNPENIYDTNDGKLTNLIKIIIAKYEYSILLGYTNFVDMTNKYYKISDSEYGKHIEIVNDTLTKSENQFYDIIIDVKKAIGKENDIITDEDIYNYIKELRNECLFSVNIVITTIFQILSSIFGIKFNECEDTSIKNNIIKMNIYDEKNELMGELYLDLLNEKIEKLHVCNIPNLKNPLVILSANYKSLDKEILSYG
jgi:hypothetical protein